MSGDNLLNSRTYHYYKTLVLKTGKRLFIQVGVNFDIGLCWFMGNANALLMSEEWYVFISV